MWENEYKRSPVVVALALSLGIKSRSLFLQMEGKAESSCVQACLPFLICLQSGVFGAGIF